MVTILYVEDEETLAMIVKDSLESHGYEVVHRKNGQEALNSFKRGELSYDVILLDVMMPIMDGFSLAEQIRKVDRKVPILFLTALTSTEDVVKGFKLGANDYIRKPFRVEELVVRIEALIRLNPDFEAKSVELYTIGQYTFDTSREELMYNGEGIKLSYREAGLLRTLLENEGKVVNREDMIGSNLDSESYFTGRSLDVFVSRLRKYMSRDSSIQITNVRGVGYKLSITQSERPKNS